MYASSVGRDMGRGRESEAIRAYLEARAARDPNAIAAAERELRALGVRPGGKGSNPAAGSTPLARQIDLLRAQCQQLQIAATLAVASASCKPVRSRRDELIASTRDDEDGLDPDAGLLAEIEADAALDAEADEEEEYRDLCEFLHGDDFED